MGRGPLPVCLLAQWQFPVPTALPWDPALSLNRSYRMDKLGTPLQLYFCPLFSPVAGTAFLCLGRHPGQLL